MRCCEHEYITIPKINKFSATEYGKTKEVADDEAAIIDVTGD